MKRYCAYRYSICNRADLLAQAVGNLIENALKYTPSGGRVQVHVASTDQRVEISIRDSGPGIPTSECARVLERFVRLDSARNSPGNGLGLSLVQAVARLHRAELLLGDAGPGLIATLRFARSARSADANTATPTR